MEHAEQQQQQRSGLRGVKATVEAAGGCKRVIHVEVEPERVDEVYSRIVKEYTKRARIPGFRPGKAPRQLIERNFREDILEDTKEKLTRETLQEVLKHEGMRQLTREEIEPGGPLEPGKAFSYTAVLEVHPEFELPDYKNINVRVEDRKVTEADIDRAMRVLQEDRAMYKDVVDRPAQEGDFVIVNFKGTIEGKPVSELAPSEKWLDSYEEAWIRIGDDEPFPGFSQQLAGVQRKEKRTIQVRVPGDYPTQELADQQITFEVEVVDIKEKVLPELNDQFAKSYGVESLEELRSRVIEDLERELETRKKRQIRDQIISTLLGRVSFELPETLVNYETRELVYNIVSEQTQRGMTKEQINARKDEIYTLASRSAQDRVKLRFILNRIAEKEGIKVSQDELVGRVFRLASVYKMRPDKFMRQLQETGGIHEIYQELLTEKTLDLLERFAQVELVPAGP